MQVREARYADVVVLGLTGPISQEASEELHALLIRLMGTLSSGAAGVVVDLGGVPYVSSAGLRTLMIAAKEYGKGGSRLALANLMPCVREVFQISRFDKVIPTFDDVRGALGSISPLAAAAFKAPPG